MADSIFKQIGALVSASINNTKTELQTKIDAETTARTAALAALQTTVNGIEITPLIDAYTKAEVDALLANNTGGSGFNQTAAEVLAELPSI